MNPSALLEEAKIAWRDLVSVWRPDRHNGNERLRRKAEEKAKQLNEAWETFPTAPRENAKPSASSEPNPNWEDLRERFRREARDKKERKRAESNENQKSKKLATKSNAVKFSTITYLLGILLFPFVKVIGALLVVTALYVYLRDTSRIRNGLDFVW